MKMLGWCFRQSWSSPSPPNSTYIRFQFVVTCIGVLCSPAGNGMTGCHTSELLDMTEINCWQLSLVHFEILSSLNLHKGVPSNAGLSYLVIRCALDQTRSALYSQFWWQSVSYHQVPCSAFVTFLWFDDLSVEITRIWRNSPFAIEFT